ncbi:MAG: histidine kinase [Acidihalobacter sp.]
MHTNDNTPAGFLPDFCRDSTLLLVVVIAELLAVVLALSSWPLAPFWRTLALTSLFVQWIALSSVAVLCRLRARLEKLSPAREATFAYLIVLGLTLLFSVLNAAFFDWVVHPNAVDLERDLAFVLRNAMVSAIVAAVGLRYLYVQHDWKLGVEARMDARLHALQARIRPHFLFNSMNTIAALIRSRPADAENAVEDLSSMFRSVLREGEWARLGDELELTRHYLALETLRLGERLQVEWALDIDEDDEELPIPALSLQPLVENAVYHGIQPNPDGGCVHIAIARDATHLRLRVENPQPQVQSGPAHDGQGMALGNIRERLELGYRGAAMNIRAEPERFTVELSLPLEAADARNDRR